MSKAKAKQTSDLDLKAQYKEITRRLDGMWACLCEDARILMSVATRLNRNPSSYSEMSRQQLETLLKRYKQHLDTIDGYERRKVELQAKFFKMAQFLS